MNRGAWHRLARNDDGAILVLALIIITTIALVVGTVLTRGDGSLRATVALRQVADSAYAADGAAKIAVNDLRTGYGYASNPTEAGFNNSLDGTGCFGNQVGVGGTDTLHLDGFYPAAGSQGASSAVVECAGESGTGMQSAPVMVNKYNKPGYAIVTLNGPVTTSDPLKVYGGVYSNSTITGPVSVSGGDAWANGACDQTTVSAPGTRQCNTGQTIQDPGTDPASASRYVSDLGGTIPPLQTPPIQCTGNVAVFTPGYYDNAAKLSTATALCPVAWFQPGAYYFDFHNDSCPNVCPANVYGTGGNVWHTGGGTIIGGTPVDADNNVLTAPPANPAVPGACQSPITDEHAVGVQFVFGGSSQLVVDNNARVELCGTYHATRPPIEMYGLKTGSTPTATNDTGRDISNGGSVISPGAFTGATVASLKAGGGGATWTTPTAAAQSSTLTIQGFQPTATVPAGAILTSATLHITHLDGDKANANPTATIKIGGSAVQTLPALTASNTKTTADIALDATHNQSVFNALQAQVHDRGYAGATVGYTVSAKKANVTSTVGPITLDLTYYLPVLRGEAGTCIDGTSGSCQFISMPGGNNKINFYLQGTTYVPLADVSIKLGNFSAEVSKFGIIARQLEFAITNGNPSWTGPIFEIPDNTPGYGYQNTTVDLIVHLCPGQPTGCTTSDPVALTARVQLWDPQGDPVPPGRQVSILSWSHPR
jgi:hypothetical protein